MDLEIRTPKRKKKSSTFAKSKTSSRTTKELGKKGNGKNGKILKQTKMERKKQYQEYKNTLKQVWSSELETEEDESIGKVPSHFKKYSLQDKKIVVHL